MRESKIEKYLRTEVAKLGGWMEKHTSPGTRGCPDNIVYWSADSYNGEGNRYCCGIVPMVEFIETKAPAGKLEVLQKRDHARRAKMGFEVWVIWDMTGAEYYLRQRGKK